jgi:CRP/FNR family cyclic AMP-dependent transcriptional regulator
MTWSTMGRAACVAIRHDGSRQMTIRDQAAPEVEALRKVPFFEGLITDDLERLATVGDRRTFEDGEAILTKDQQGAALFVIISGTASVRVGGAEHVLRSGDFIGEMALLAGRPRSATVVADGPVEALVLETMYFRPFLMKNPSVAVALLEGVAARLREVQDRVDATEGNVPPPGG